MCVSGIEPGSYNVPALKRNFSGPEELKAARESEEVVENSGKSDTGSTAVAPPAWPPPKIPAVVPKTPPRPAGAGGDCPKIPEFWRASGSPAGDEAGSNDKQSTHGSRAGRFGRHKIGSEGVCGGQCWPKIKETLANQNPVTLPSRTQVLGRSGHLAGFRQRVAFPVPCPNDPQVRVWLAVASVSFSVAT